MPPRTWSRASITQGMVQAEPGRGRILRTDRLPAPPADNLRGRQRVRQGVGLAPVPRPRGGVRASPRRPLGCGPLLRHRDPLLRRRRHRLVRVAQLEQQLRPDPARRARRRSGQPARLGEAVDTLPGHRAVGRRRRRRGAAARGYGAVADREGRGGEVEWSWRWGLESVGWWE